MLMTACVVGLITVIVYMTLIGRVHKQGIKLAAGYSFWVDLLFTGIIAGMAAATGSLTALVISSVTGLFISITLFGIKWYHGYAKVTRVIDEEGNKTWKFNIEEFAPTKSLPTWVSKITSKFSKKKVVMA